MSKDFIVEELIQVAIKAGQKIIEVRATGFDIEKKGDGSPVTIADQQAEKIIIDCLELLSPQTPIVAEERFFSEGGEELEGANKFFLVDALDGTKSFVEGGDGFTVNIALVEDNCSVLGVVYAPCDDVVYVGDVKEDKAFKLSKATSKNPIKEKINVRRRPAQGAVVVSSIHHIDDATKSLIARLEGAKVEPTSSSIKFCKIAEGVADLYPRFGAIMEWDTAAGQAVLNAAGGHVLTAEGEKFLYGKSGFKNTSFIALGDKSDVSFWLLAF